MTITLAGSDALGFGVTGAGVVYNYGGAGAPTVGQWDVLGVNSDAQINTPAGYTLAVSRVGQQGAYLFVRKAVGGEAATVTISSPSGAGPFNAEVMWCRLNQADGLDAAVQNGIDSSSDVTTPAVSTGALAGSTEAVVTFAALHGLPAGAPITPLWSAGYSNLQSVTFGAGNSGVAGFLGLKIGAGTPAETPNVTWTNNASDRYALVVSFTESADCPTCPECPDCPASPCTISNMAGFAPIVTGVGTCVIEALDQTVAGAPCRQCLLLPTQQIPWDNCGPCDDISCSGQIALAIQNVYGSSHFPQPEAGKDWSHCGPPWQVAQVVVSVTRCVPTMDQTGNPPTCAAELAAALTLEADRSAIRQALACCLTALKAAHSIGAWSMNPSVTVGEQGGCAGVETTFLVAQRSCLCGQT